LNAEEDVERRSFLGAAVSNALSEELKFQGAIHSHGRFGRIESRIKNNGEL
jgi:hypothetical protein